MRISDWSSDVCSSDHESAVPQLAEEFRRFDVDTVLAPDKGAMDRATVASEILGCAVDHLEKTRLSSTEVQIKAKSLDVRDKQIGRATCRERVCKYVEI